MSGQEQPIRSVAPAMSTHRPPTQPTYGGRRILRRRNTVCRDRDCNCYCHWDIKGFSHCHDGRKCRDVQCGCNNPISLYEVPTPLSDLFPKVTVKRGGIKYPTPSAGTFTIPLKDEALRRLSVELDVPLDIIRSADTGRFNPPERKPMYSVRVVIEEEGRPLVDIDITTTRPREGINAAAKAADDAMKAHPDGPEEPSRPTPPDFSGIQPAGDVRRYSEYTSGGPITVSERDLGPQVSHQPGGSRF